MTIRRRRPKAVDKFGYYNGRTGNTDLVERQLVEFGTPYDGDRGVCYAYIGGADRTPDILFAQVYSLQSIKYPTGAREELVYESIHIPIQMNMGMQFHLMPVVCEFILSNAVMWKVR